MKHVIVALCGLLIMAGLAGCRNTDPASRGGAVTAADLVHHRYEIVSFNDEPIEADGDVAIEISFGENMHVSGKACNRFNGKGSVENGVLKAPNMVATKMFCADQRVNVLESALFGMLQTGAEVHLEGDRLILEGKDNTIVYTRRDLVQ